MDKTAIQQIVLEYRTTQGDGKPITLDAMATALADNVLGIRCSRQAIWMWEAGQQEPGLDMLITLFVSTQHDDWRHSFAADLLAAKRPDIYSPVGEIGKRILMSDNGQAVIARP